LSLNRECVAEGQKQIGHKRQMAIKGRWPFIDSTVLFLFIFLESLSRIEKNTIAKIGFKITNMPVGATHVFLTLRHYPQNQPIEW
jgi:hypothetical protein